MRRKGICALLVVLVAVSAGYADTRQWTESYRYHGDWSSASNWSPAVVPSADDDIIVADPTPRATSEMDLMSAGDCFLINRMELKNGMTLQMVTFELAVTDFVEIENTIFVVSAGAGEINCGGYIKIGGKAATTLTVVDVLFHNSGDGECLAGP